MIVLQANKIEKRYGERRLLDGVSFTLQQNDRLGLVGANGTGKSTLLGIITGETRADGGAVQVAKGLRLGFLRQQIGFTQGNTLIGETESVFASLREMEEKITEFTTRMAQQHEDEDAYAALCRDYARLSEEFEARDGYAWRSRAQGMLIGLGFTRDEFSRDVGSLSGGERMRLHLAITLLSQPDILLLDEPTNHLDLNALAFLEDFLGKYPGAVVIVSHDRYFLDRVCTGIAEIRFGQLHQYAGNYSRYIELRDAIYERQAKEYANKSREIERQKAIIARYRQFNREKSIKAARSREKHLGRLMEDLQDLPAQEKTAFFRFRANKRSGDIALTGLDLSKRYGERCLFAQVDLEVRAGERIAIIGPNGSGKSTLMDMLAGKRLSDTGEVFRGANVSVGNFDQHQRGLIETNTIFEEIASAQPRLTDTQIRNALAAFLFTGDDVFKRIGDLSGGERARVNLTKLMLRGDNLLMLDEPTNHLDMDTREMLEMALMDYEGTILAISHDRYFINRLFGKIWALEAQGIAPYLGDYDDYARAKSRDVGEEKAEAVNRTQLAREKKRSREEKAAEQQRKQALREIQARIEDLERRKADLEAAMAAPGYYDDIDAAREGAQFYAELTADIEAAYAAWEDMEE